MKIPRFFKDYAVNYSEDDYVNFDIKDTDGCEAFEIHYYGEFFTVRGENRPFIVATDFAPARIYARNPSTGKDILLFDGTSFGYDAMFCDTYTEEQIEKRPLQKLDTPPVKVSIKLGYSIDYEDEKEDYEPDENDIVTLINGKQIPWAQVVTDGFDYINISVTLPDGEVWEIGDAELA